VVIALRRLYENLVSWHPTALRNLPGVYDIIFLGNAYDAPNDSIGVMDFCGVFCMVLCDGLGLGCARCTKETI